MKRIPEQLTNKEFDLIIVGGGIFGCCALWDATRRGLSAVLIDKGDFSQATSANHYKIAHGGIRYLQHADFYRVRESSRERSALLRIAPHLVKPLPIVVPTYGHGVKGKEFLAAGLLLYDLVTFDRNKGIKDSNRHIPRGKLLSRDEIINLFPGIESKNLSGGALFYDAQMYNPPRLALAFLRSAINAGAEAANYFKAIKFLRNEDEFYGVEAEDILTGNVFEIRGKMILNTAGPWANQLLDHAAGIKLNQEPIFSRDLAFIVSKKFNEKYSFACQIKSTDADAIIDRGGRHIFISPWRNYSLVGVWHKVYKENPDRVAASEAELNEYINDVNSVYPFFNLSLNDITMVNTGLTLFGEENKQGERTLSFGHRSLLIDHQEIHKMKGLVTLIGVRATTARGMAEKAINLILIKLNRRFIKSDTESTAIYGGDFEIFDKLLQDANQSYKFEADMLKSLVHNHGSEFRKVLAYDSSNEIIEGTKTLKAEIIHAIREEMAVKLSDVIFRRTDIGTGAYPGENAIKECADIMSQELGWSREKKDYEISEVTSAYVNYGSVKNYSDVNEVTH